jgi:hypothetical protein
MLLTDRRRQLAPDRLRDSGREQVFQILHTLDCIGIHALLSADYQHTDARGTTSLVDEGYHAISSDPNVSVPPAGSQADDVEAFDRPSNSQSVKLLFESFLQTTNHVLFLFSEFELRRSFRPSEYILEQDLSIDMCLVLALGAKYSITQVDGTQNEWYTRARLRLLSEDFEDDMWMMRVLAMICIFEIDGDINVSCRFLGKKRHLKPIQ